MNSIWYSSTTCGPLAWHRQQCHPLEWNWREVDLFRTAGVVIAAKPMHFFFTIQSNQRRIYKKYCDKNYDFQLSLLTRLLIGPLIIVIIMAMMTWDGKVFICIFFLRNIESSSNYSDTSVSKLGSTIIMGSVVDF